ncbi:MAG: hypothetical protein EA360_08580 [Balneolaceae bacterium]|nr:MAG: hypothetical protein EA360_08580 [Balneolaceae bacterium]
MNYAQKLYYAVSSWLRPDNFTLKEAIEQSVDEGLFSFPDLKYQIRALKQTLTLPAIERWLALTSVQPGTLEGKKILSLNAGNLPLVGVHDLIGITLTGADYNGKLSRKDPYLLPSFLSILQQEFPKIQFIWSESLSDFGGMKADALIYTGSEENRNEVNNLLKSMNIISDATPTLTRTTHFSVAWIQNRNQLTMEELTNAMLRYNGHGCRSVAMVVAPFGLKEIECHLADVIELFWMENPPHKPPVKALLYRYAYNRASGTNQIWMNNFLIEERMEKPEHPSVVQWFQGDESDLRTFLKKHRGGIQTVYTEDDKAGDELEGFITEPLSSSQVPPLWWKPDGVDTLEWLISNLEDIG